MIKIRTDHDDTPWITPGKIYEAELVEGYTKLYKFIGDKGETNHTTLKNSLHIHGKDWEIVE